MKEETTRKESAETELPKYKYNEETGIWYTLVGDYYLPNLTLPEEPKIGKYGRMRQKYIAENNPIMYNTMMINETMNAHLEEVDRKAKERVEQLVEQMKANSDLTESMKSTDPLHWIGTMNNFKAAAEEIVYKELIFC